MPWGAPIGTGRGLANPYALQTHARTISPTCRWSSMPASARPRMRRRRWRWASTRVLLNTAVAKAADPVRMARAFAAGDRGRPHGLRGRPDGACATWRSRRRRSPARRSSISKRGDDMSAHAAGLDVFYPIVPDARLGRAARAARRRHDPAAPQGCRRRRGAPARSPRAWTMCAPPRLPADRQRLLARGDRRSAPTTSTSARRIWPPPTWPRSRPRACGSASPRTARRSSTSRSPPSPTTSRWARSTRPSSRR